MPTIAPAPIRTALGFFTATTIIVITSIAIAQTAPPENGTVALRPTGTPLSGSMVRAIAEAGPAIRLTKDQYPEAGHFTAREIARVLCGTPPAAYFQLLAKKNNLSISDFDKPLGERAYDIEFPACLNIDIYSKAQPYKVKQGDTFNAIREAFTGVQGTPATNAHFFGVSIPRIVSGKLSVGETLHIPYSTSATILPQRSANAVLSAFTAANAPIDKLVQQKPRARGHIVSFVSSGTNQSSTSESVLECGTAIVHPFDANGVRDAFKFEVGRAKDENIDAPAQVEIMVVDNGFFGAKPDQDGLKFRDPEFRKGFFDTQSFGSNLGPTTGIAPNDVYPNNYQNGLSPGGPLSGHGTHVTGLVLGGPDFLKFRDQVFGTTGPAWLKVAELNIGRGSDELLPGSEQQISRRLLLLGRSRIINLSISYDQGIPDISSSFAFMNQGSEQSQIGARHLYVVAAGNDNGDNAANYYPAGLGGVDRSNNVVTVVALNAAGKLTKFSNIGPKATDVAAPGCNIASWIDDTSPPVALSGTSQAAPIVSFEAALIRGLTNASPKELKARIIASGDLLQDTDRDYISGHVKINVVTSLYAYDDYIEYIPNGSSDTTPQRLLGTVLRVDGLSCADGQGNVKMDELLSIKSDGAAYLAYFADPKNKIVTICPLRAPASRDAIVFKSGYKISESYSPIADRPVIQIPIKTMRNMVMRMKKAD